MIADGKIVGTVMSAAYAHTIGAALGLAMVDASVVENEAPVQVDIAGEVVKATLSVRPLYDLSGARMRSRPEVARRRAPSRSSSGGASARSPSRSSPSSPGSSSGRRRMRRRFARPRRGTEFVYSGPDNYLAWVPGGFDDPAFRQKMERLPGLDEAVVVAGDTLARRTEDAQGLVVDEPKSPFAFPIDAFAVDANDYAPFVGTSVREEIVRALGADQAVLVSTARVSDASAPAGGSCSGPARSVSARSSRTTPSGGPRCS